MATVRADNGSESTNQQREAVDWSAAVPKAVNTEDAMSPEHVKSIWEKMYRQAGMSTANEKERRAFRAAVYVYGALNGTSREGEYSATMDLSNGKSIPASVITTAAGKMRIRKFFRGNMNESYEFFKTSKVMEQYPRFLAKCANFGIAPENAFATADWLADCPLFTPGEAKAHEAMFTHSLSRARRARDGKTLEDVENGRVESNLQAQGPADSHGHRFDF